MKKRLILVRHGETEWNARAILQGQADIALSDRGRRQVQAIAPIVAEMAPDTVLSSDLKRAAETAALLGFQDASRQIRWREADLGDWQGKAKTELDPQQYKAWRAGRFHPPGGEGWAAFRVRIATAIDHLPASGTTLVVTHGGAIRAALSVLVGLEQGRIMPVDPASLTVLELDGPARLKTYNLTGRVSAQDNTD